MNKIIDSHGHYYTRHYDKDRDKLLKTLHNEKNIELIINCGQNIKENKQVLDLSTKYDFCYSVIGFFPTFVEELDKLENLENFIKQLKTEKVIGLGEIGLDYHWNKPDSIIQKEWFIKQIEIANELKLPICVHSRDAEKDTLDILSNNKVDYGCVIHCYSYGLASAKKYVNKGFYFGVGGTSTYKQNNDLREAIKYIPLEQILLETDAPYLTPEPHRRQRNDASQIIYVAENIAKIKDISVDKVIEITNKNTKQFYKIKE